MLGFQNLIIVLCYILSSFILPVFKIPLHAILQYIRSPTDGNLEDFQLVAIVNTTAINIPVHFHSHKGEFPRNGIAELKHICFFNFTRCCQTGLLSSYFNLDSHK